MADAWGRAGSGAAGNEPPPAPQEVAILALRMLERLIAGSTLTEVAAGEGLTPRRARELVAEVVAQRGFDPEALFLAERLQTSGCFRSAVCA
jgi:hypothetical protein